ncbi:hypothetical protein K1T71_003072 [Dendrolimus kikuchii]|uniref:Uncharacterized protein n=1 Tax=Dendrolimus kikuchii TaxID=765133 RepID=A0ACC1DBL7_9NEOP|nr:hypothetical protein K1T71_003072 [Dendrolimus kikuchii]
MLGGVGGRHASVRRRGSSPGVRRHLAGAGAAAAGDSPPASPRPTRRRRAALAATDHKTCALIHTRLKLGDIMFRRSKRICIAGDECVIWSKAEAEGSKARCGLSARCGSARAVAAASGARAVRGPVACSARRGRPHRSVEQEPAMPGPRLSRAA